MTQENKRQVFHILVGLLAIAVLLYFGRGVTIALVFFIIIFGLLIMNARILHYKNPITKLIQWFEHNFERPDVPLPGWGSACYATGILIVLTALTDVNEMVAIIIILALGDGFSTLVGRNGKTRIPYNNKKTIEGTIAFMIASLPACYFIGPIGVPLIILGAIIETLPLIDDNLMIPIVTTAFLVIL
ncbi:MAG: hypothetical protein ABH842_03175 [Candidatus Micrarchaeota archaeon]